MDLTKSLPLKVVCHIFLPIMLGIMIISILSIISVEEYPEVKTEKNFFETKLFSESYLSQIGTVVRNIEYRSIESDIGESIENDTIHYLYNMNEIEYLIINNTTNIAYTNIEKTGNTDTLEKIINYFSVKEGQYWIYQNGEVDTSINKLTMNEIKYKYYFEDVIHEKYTIYSQLNQNIDILNSDFFVSNITYNLISKTYEHSYYLLPMSIIATVGIFVYLLMGIGHKPGTEEIYLNKFDKLPLGIAGLILGILLIFFVPILLYFGSTNNFIAISFLIFSAFVTYIICWIGFITFVRRIKAGTLLKNTIIYKTYSWTKKKIKEIFENFNVTFKIGIIYGIVILMSVVIMYSRSVFWTLVLFLLYIYILNCIVKWINKCKKIEKALKDLYEGKKDIKLDETEFNGQLKNTSIYINDIAAGFSNAIEENLKSERFKTELITNVSHDIKTPLTSIINYVDLLKKEGLTSNNSKEYLQIIDQKSQKLKKLTEDLIEVSKATSGNIKLNIEKLDAKELIKQFLGEYRDKFNNKGLDVYTKIPDEDVFIKADGKYISRVLDNLFSNISKYALDNTRVYIDIIKKGQNAVIELKNISKEKLNISKEELMQRFVRGDSSRNTEGSGLRPINSKKPNKFTKWRI